MEKTGTGNNRKQRFGLLTSMALLVMLAGIFFPQQLSAAPSWNYMTSLRFRQCEDYFFTKSSCSYSVDIKGVDPNEVTVYMNSIPDNVELLTIKKDTYIPPASEADIGFGTHVTVTVRFAQSGDYTLHPVDMQIGGGYYQVRFERVHVYENIQVIQPQLSIRFANPQYAGSKNIATAKVGDHILFTVCVRYAAQITGLSWNLPENSLFTEERRYDIVEKNPHHEFSPDAVPVITFDWQPLVPGTYELPLVSVTANAYSGISVNLPFPHQKIQVLASDKTVGPSAGWNHEVPGYTQAFDAPENPDSSAQAVTLTQQDLKSLVALHRAERYALPFDFLFTKNALHARQEAEKSYGLTPGASEPNVPLLVLFLSGALLFAVVTVLVFASRHFPAGTICFIIFVFCLSAGTFSLVKVSAQYAVCCGGEMLPIPEQRIAKGIPVQAGSVVKIEKKAGGWLYVSQNDTYGWLPETAVISISMSEKQ